MLTSKTQNMCTVKLESLFLDIFDQDAGLGQNFLFLFPSDFLMTPAYCQSFGTDTIESWIHYALELLNVPSQNSAYIYTLSKCKHVGTIIH